MKKIFCLIMMQIIVSASIANTVTFKLNGGTDNETLKATIETNISSLLTEFGAALDAKRAINFEGISIADKVDESIKTLWNNVKFSSIDNVIIERLLETPNGYQIRNIPLTLALNGTEIAAKDSYQEAVMDLDKNGKIQSFYFAVSNTLYMQVMKTAGDVTDTRRRQLILDYVEHFRTAYNQKDINFLNQVFSDDAIIITGKVITTKPSDTNIRPTEKITYNVQGKKEYLTRLQRVFNANKHINVKFSEIKVSRHATRADFYGVLLHQGYSSDIYSDEGYVFLLWDFRNELQPKIHVRTWQPYYLDQEKTKVIADKEVFDISSFDL